MDPKVKLSISFDLVIDADRDTIDKIHGAVIDNAQVALIETEEEEVIDVTAKDSKPIMTFMTNANIQNKE